MILINKRVTISSENKKVEFDLADLLDGDYEVQLTIESVDRSTKKVDFSPRVQPVEIPSHLQFNGQAVYRDDNN